MTTPTLRRLAATLALAAAPALALAAPTYTGYGALVQLEGGWSANAMSIAHAKPLVNPDGCPVTNAGYATSPSDPGANLFHTLLLSALMNRKEVNLLVNGCVFDKPRVISVTVRP